MIHKYVTSGGTEVLAGDYVNYDLKAWFPRLCTNVYSIMITLNRLYGDFAPRDFMCMYGVAHDVSNPIVLFFGTLFQMSGGNPSGQSGTTPANGFGNSIMVRYAFVVSQCRARGWERCVGAYSDLLVEFDRYVNLITYGDDHIAGVHPSIRGFHCYSVARALDELFVSYTDSQKSDILPTFLRHIEEETFLKRRFVVDGDRVLAPLEEKSMYKSGLLVLDPELDPINHARTFVQNLMRSACHHSVGEFERFALVAKALDTTLVLGVLGLDEGREWWLEREYAPATRVL